MVHSSKLTGVAAQTLQHLVDAERFPLMAVAGAVDPDGSSPSTATAVALVVDPDGS